jgi:hypothetical protein
MESHMSELDDSFAKLLGRQPSDAERQQLYKVRDALGLKNNDALWLVLIALQHYENIYASIPASITAAANKAAQGAAAQARAEVNNAVAKLIPTVQAAVKEGARSALAQEALGKSMLTLVAGSAIIGLIFAAGLLYGARIFASAASGGLSWANFWDQVGWSLTLGTAAPGLLLLGVAQIGEETAWWQYLALLLAFGAIAMPAIRLGMVLF